MEIELPREPVYYYECSAGRFRLVYFIPPGELRRLCDEGRISERALKDLPDGVDLGCTEPDFAEFEEQYNYRPPLDPMALQRAFFTILSSTRSWRAFSGSGSIAAWDIEKQIAEIDEELEASDLESVATSRVPDQLTLKQRRRWRQHREAGKRRVQRALRQLPAKGIDPRKTLREQTFSEIAMGAGEPAEKVFSELHQKQER